MPIPPMLCSDTSATIPVWLRLRDGDEVVPDSDTEWDHWGAPYAEGLHDATRFVVVADLGRGPEPVGTMSSMPVFHGPTIGCRAWSIGIGLAEFATGRGIGTTAQRLLARHLLETTEVHRIEASTDVDNIAEQRSLEKAGFRREGVARGAQWRADGRYHDLVLYSLLRTD